MRNIYKLYHELTANDFQKVYHARMSFDATAHIGLRIKPMNQPHVYELYYVPTNEMIKMISQIYLVSHNFQETFNELPTVAQNQFINDCLVEELFNTNQLEGIRSTKEEIARSAKEVRLNGKSKKRFDSMIMSYMRLLQNDIDLPYAPKDIRNMYDEITNGEIEQQELPNGEVFRKETSYVLKKSVEGKVVHKGITPEQEIFYAVEELIKFMNDNEDIPTLIKVAIGHYYFGYIHPFYDGNGRTSRFISSLYLSKQIGNISALSLSRGCNKYRNKYLEAFEITNSIKCRGEMNCFIETFLSILIKALIEMNVELREKSELLSIAANKLESEPKLQGREKFNKEVMFILAQNHFFDSKSGLTTRELSDILNKSEATIRKALKELLALCLIEQKGERPAYYSIKQRYFEV